MKHGTSISELIRNSAESLFGNSRQSNQEQYGNLHAAGPGPTPVDWLKAPEGPEIYATIYEDAARARALSIITDPDLHFTLYGRQQGRALLHHIPADLRRVVLIAPSYLKQCGIGEYARYLASVLKQQVDEIEVVRTSAAALELGREFLEGTLVLVNHGPGLFDGLNPRLSQGESTTRLLQNLDRLAREMGAIPLIIHHSLLDTDHDLLFSRQQQILNSNIPSVAFIDSAGRHFFIPTVELGVSPVQPDQAEEADTPSLADRDMRPEVVGFFGFFQYGGKDFDSLFHLVRELRGKLVGSVATGNEDELVRFEETLAALKLPHDLGSGWVEDTELLARLREADYFYLPQNDYDHWNNSATARFVTNLDRPLFLPPHQPFLDMADGSIFASRDDLPRIVAHFREDMHFTRAVARVRAFRDRAGMANTANALRREMVMRTVQIGRELLENPAALSAERFEELEGGARASFAEALGAPADAGLETVLPYLPALYRSVAPRQYWRKHYETGDLVHGTLLDTIHAAYLACAKRHVSFRELIGLLCDTLDPENPVLWPFGKTAQTAILNALNDKGGLFHDPEIVLVENGVLEPDWQTLLEPRRLEDLATAKTARVARVCAAARQADTPLPEITNLAELLILPADILRARRAPIDLGLLDFDALQSVRSHSRRMNRLLDQANAAGLELGDHLVFDHLVVPATAPAVSRYTIEDFVFFQGDLFLLNAVRCIDKRDPFPLEMMALSALLNAFGMASVLQHLLIRAGGRVEITNFDQKRDFESDGKSFCRFMESARDPLMGLIEPRNAYEMQKRHNARWWLTNKTACDALYKDCNSDLGLLNILYALLAATADERADISLRRGNPSWQIDRQGRHFRTATTAEDGLVLHNASIFSITPVHRGAFETASSGFHPPEVIGAWTNGPEASVLLSLDPGEFDASEKDRLALHVQVGFAGSALFDSPRKLTLSLEPAAPSARSLFEASETAQVPLMNISHSVAEDVPVTISGPLEGLTEKGLYVLRLEIDRIANPAALGLSVDGRDLGVLLKSLSFASVTAPPMAKDNAEEQPATAL